MLEPKSQAKSYGCQPHISRSWPKSVVGGMIKMQTASWKKGETVRCVTIEKIHLQSSGVWRLGISFGTKGIDKKKVRKAPENQEVWEGDPTQVAKTHREHPHVQGSCQGHGVIIFVILRHHLGCKLGRCQSCKRPFAGQIVEGEVAVTLVFVGEEIHHVHVGGVEEDPVVKVLQLLQVVGELTMFILTPICAEVRHTDIFHWKKRMGKLDAEEVKGRNWCRRSSEKLRKLRFWALKSFINCVICNKDFSANYY